MGIEEIQTKIIDEMGKQVQDILSVIFTGANQVLDQFFHLVEVTACEHITGNVDKILEFLDDVGSSCRPSDPCCLQIGYDEPIILKKIASEAPTKLYDLHICHRMKDISENSSAHSANYGSSAARDLFSQEYTNWGAKYFIWSKMVDSA